MGFAVALLVVLTGALLATGWGMRRARAETPILPADRRAATAAHVAQGGRSPRFDFRSGLSTGIVCAWVTPAVFEHLVWDRHSTPDWQHFAPGLAIAAGGLLVHAALRKRNDYGLGVAAGAGLVSIALPLVVVTIMITLDTIF